MAWASMISCAVDRGGRQGLGHIGYVGRKWGQSTCGEYWGAFGHGMLIFVKVILYISRHGKVRMFVFIIPFQSDAAVESTIPIF
jgi:hypothetical protein